MPPWKTPPPNAGFRERKGAARVRQHRYPTESRWATTACSVARHPQQAMQPSIVSVYNNDASSQHSFGDLFLPTLRYPSIVSNSEQTVPSSDAILLIVRGHRRSRFSSDLFNLLACSHVQRFLAIDEWSSHEHPIKMRPPRVQLCTGIRQKTLQRCLCRCSRHGKANVSMPTPKLQERNTESVVFSPLNLALQGFLVGGFIVRSQREEASHTYDNFCDAHRTARAR